VKLPGREAQQAHSGQQRIGDKAQQAAQNNQYRFRLGSRRLAGMHSDDRGSDCYAEPGPAVRSAQHTGQPANLEHDEIQKHAFNFLFPFLKEKRARTFTNELGVVIPVKTGIQSLQGLLDSR
jgi:hypothetical protein